MAITVRANVTIDGAFQIYCEVGRAGLQRAARGRRPVPRRTPMQLHECFAESTDIPPPTKSVKFRPLSPPRSAPKEITALLPIADAPETAAAIRDAEAALLGLLEGTGAP